MATYLQVLPPEMVRDDGHYILASFLIERAEQLGEVGSLLTQPTTNFKVPEDDGFASISSPAERQPSSSPGSLRQS